MREKHGQSKNAHRETRLLERLRRRPELMERFEAILELAETEGGSLRSADEVEALLVEEVRRLGSGVMHEWARGAEERVGAELREETPKVRIRKKKP